MTYNREDVKGKIRDYRDAYPRFNHEYWTTELAAIEGDEGIAIDNIYAQLKRIEPILKVK